MARIKLDKIDRKILANLQNSGRMTNVDLAKEAGISAPPCLRRVRALEDAGFIKSYHARLDNKALGYGVTIFAKVKLESHADTELKAFEKACADWDCVRECWMLTGDTDFLLKIVARDWDDYQQFLTNQLTASPNISGVKSSLSIRASKEETGIPVDAC
ncbi:MAG: Lrp/AsnC family transcriptional regulator [Alphaproteobacteria bacterium]|nr:Lrp/AsnC family transcriptional regulator [Alphaproteobacteria bacterium]